MKLKLTKTQPVTNDVTSFILEPEGKLEWKPGQYMHYFLPHPNIDDRHDDRWFTISSAPFEGHAQITTRFSPESSSFKAALKMLPIGAEIEAEGPEGEFVVSDPDRNYIFIAGGIGITPFRSILAQADHDGQKLNVTLLYGNRDNNIIFKDELDRLVERNPNLKIEYIVDPEKIDEAKLKEAIESVENPYIYLSGPEPMVEAFEEQVKNMGVDEKNIQTDFFPGYDKI
jgi:glycine betaine catabolism B